MVKTGTYLIPTQRAGLGLNQPSIKDIMPPEVIDKIDQVVRGMMENHKIAFEKGVNIGLGTDSGTPSNAHGTTAKEITSMVENVGMSPSQAIQTATINSAKAIQRDNMIGSIETGKLADFVVVNGDPFENIQILEDLSNLEYVIKDGIIQAKNGKLIR